MWPGAFLPQFTPRSPVAQSARPAAHPGAHQGAHRVIALSTHGDVTRLEMSSRRSRLVGYAVSAYLVRGVLVDTGFPAIGAEFARFVAERRPRGILLTHVHEDHAGNVALAARLGVPLGAAAATLDELRRVGPIGFYRRYTWGAMAPLDGRAPEPFADDALTLLPTPGHSPDHHAVWDAESRTIFGGDLFLGVRVRVARADEDPRALVASLRSAAALEPLRLFDAHRGPVRDPVAALTAKADWLAETIAAVERLAAEGLSDDAVRRAVLGREEMAGYFSLGDYSRTNFVRAIRRNGG